MRHAILLLCTCLFVPSMLMAQLPTIQSIDMLTANAEQNQKVELRVNLSATFDNPYEYEKVHVWADVVGPSGDSLQVDGFYLETYTGPEPIGLLVMEDSGEFRVRFAPREPGTWSYQVYVKDSVGMASSQVESLTVLPAVAESNHGFVRLSETNYLQFDDGTGFIPLGHNLGWPNGNPFGDYQTWLDRMSQVGANFFRIWNCDWGLSLEWYGGKYDGLAHYEQRNAAYLDWLFDHAGTQDMYAMLCLQHHGQVSTNVNPQWSQSPYNVANGGMCTQPWDFFTHPEARAYTRNRLRYTVARYGYARSIMAWELFNEVDWTDEYDSRKADVANWHDEMSMFLKEIDPYGRLVSTSFAEDQYDPSVWTLPSIDFTQTHYYAAISNLERTLAHGVQSYLTEFDKPSLTGEYGIRTDGAALSSEDPTGIHIHNSIWGSLFGGGMGCGLSWWWDNYIHPQNLYDHYSSLATVVSEIPLMEEAYAPASHRIEGAPGDLVLTPNQGWGSTNDATITLLPDGSTQPQTPLLGEYLYGAQWNTQFRNPPTFEVAYPTTGNFSVRTGANASQDPRIVIRVDGVIELNQPAQINQTYTISVPAGSHSIAVSNEGTDWITISGYTFEGLGSALDAYLLKARNDSSLAAWVLNHRYNHIQLQETGVPSAVSGATLVVPDMAAGSYFAKWYNCLTGTLLQTEAVSPVDDTLRLMVPDVTWDLALVVDDQLITQLSDATQSLAVTAYPNPWRADLLTITLPASLSGEVSVALLDAAGRTAKTWASRSADSQMTLPYPADLVPGVYWLKVSLPGWSGTIPLWIG